MRSPSHFMDDLIYKDSFDSTLVWGARFSLRVSERHEISSESEDDL